jgi:outer membrane protein assembly factor BamB
MSRLYGVLAVLSGLVVLTCHPPVPPNQKPNRPGTPDGPRSGKARTTYYYSAQTTDPDGDSVSYQFDFGKGDTLGWSRFLPGGVPDTEQVQWIDDNERTVRVRAQDRLFARSEWSDGLTVSLSNSPPGLPQFDYFPDTVWPGTLDTIRVFSVDPDNDRLRFIVDWGESAAVDTYDFTQSAALSTYGQHWLIPGSYPIRVQAVDDHGLSSDWTPTRVIAVPGPALLWRYFVGAPVADAPALGPDRTIYFKTDNRVFALNPDGTPKWQYRINNWRSAPVSVSPKNTIYVRSGTKTLSAISSAGELAWTFTFRSAGSTMPLMTSALGMNGVIYHRADSLYALDAGGTMLWRSWRGRSNNSPAVVGADGTIYFSSEGRDSVYALNPDGTLRWGTYCASARRFAPPVIGQDGMIILCGGAHSLAAFSALGTSLWALDLSGPVKALPPAVGPGGVTYWGGDDGLSAIAPNGWWLWRFPTRSEVLTTPAITSDTTIVFGCNDHLLRGIGPDGKIRWAFGTRGDVRSSPVIAPDGTIYFGSDDGYLYAIEGHSPLADSPWPMFHHDPQHTGRAGTP